MQETGQDQIAADNTGQETRCTSHGVTDDYNYMYVSVVFTH